MAQDQRRDQMVRLPNPSAQPFVAALKTARFFAVLFFWVTMVCVLAHVATFVLTEWVHLYDVAVPEAAPAAAPADPAAPAGPVVPAAPSVEEKGPAGQVRLLGLFEGVAAAAEPGELFPNVPSQPSPKKPAKEAAPAPAETDEKVVPPPAEATEGTIVGEPEQPAPARPAPLTPEQRRLRATYYRNVTASILGPARIIGVLASLLLAVTLFIYLQIALLGRLAGIRHLTQALFVLLLFLVTVVPWEGVFEGFRTTALVGFEDLLEAHAARSRGLEIDLCGHLRYFGRFLLMPLVSTVLLAWTGVQFAVGYSDSVLSNE